MRASLQLGVSAALVLSLSACAESAPKPKPRGVWVVEDGRTLVHNPSGIRVLQQAGRFQLTKRYTGEREDLVVVYDAGPEPGTVRIYFSGVMGPIPQPCDALVARRAERVGQRAEFTQQIGSWTDLAPLFVGMEAGRAAVYDSELDMDGVNLPTRSELYVLCGTGGSWFLEYRADYLRDAQGGDWINELIAATAPD